MYMWVFATDIPVHNLKLWCMWQNRQSLGLHPANERRRYKVTPSLISPAQV